MLTYSNCIIFKPIHVCTTRYISAVTIHSAVTEKQLISPGDVASEVTVRSGAGKYNGVMKTTGKLQITIPLIGCIYTRRFRRNEPAYGGN